MLDNLILHETTRAQMDNFAARPSHSLLLTGPTGIGKTAIAEALAAAMLGVRLDSHPYHLTVRPDGASISIESVRNLQKFLLLKTTGTQSLRRTILIEYAHALTTEAQNAFLKLLEEPPADTLIILTASTPRALLPTILSRTQHIAITSPTEEQLQSLISQSGKSQEEARQAYFLSGGLPGLLSALLSDGEDHPLLSSVNLAKEVLQKQSFERLAMVDGLSKQKEVALGLAEALERIAQAGMAGASTKQETARIQRWHTIRKEALRAQEALRASANTKLVLDNLFLCIS